MMFLKVTVTELNHRCSDIQGENREIQKQLRDCHVLLVAENLDPGDWFLPVCWVMSPNKWR